LRLFLALSFPGVRMYGKLLSEIFTQCEFFRSYQDMEVERGSSAVYIRL
jgi:hypothetical protein